MPTFRSVIRRFALLATVAALACASQAAALANGTILVKFASTNGTSAKVEALGDEVERHDGQRR